MASNPDYWDPGERDVEGQDQEAILPSLIEDIKKVLAQYPDDGQILKEMVQNAEDAEATTVKVLADNRQFHQTFESHVLEACPHLRYFKGPALCVYNEMEFDADDWQSIRMLHKSVKEKNPLKVGRFGLGFKSVFHLTDRVVIISGDTILYMDPSKGAARYCNKKRLADIRGRELQSILHCTEGPLFGISRETFQKGYFKGTLFWFPLRLSPTSLSTSPVAYSERNLQDLLNSFKEEGGSMLLFLNNIEQIHGYTRKAGQDAQRHFSVTVADSCLQSVRSARKTFYQSLPKIQGTLPRDAVYSKLTKLTTETVDHIAKTHDIQSWRIVNYYPGQGELSATYVTLCTNHELNYRPCVGIACPVDTQSTFQSQVFCTLPLPLDTRSLTGLPVHVNGSFALSSNRRHIEWPDRRRGREFFESTVQWNLFLVEVLLPRAYARLLERIVREDRMSAETFYSLWPDMSTVEDRWEVLAKQLYRHIASRCVFFTEANQGEWVALNQAVLSRFSPDVTSNVTDAVVKVYRACEINLVELPEHVQEGLDQQGLLNNVNCVNTRDVTRLVPWCLKRLTREDKLHVLEYLCSQGTVEELENLELLPLANLNFGVFTNIRSRSAEAIYWCDESLLLLFPDILSNFCDSKLPVHLRQHLCRIAESGKFSIRILYSDSTDVPRLVQKNFEVRFGNGAPVLPSDDHWIKHVWQFLSRVGPWEENLGNFMHLTLLPSMQGAFVRLLPLTGVYVSSSGQRFYNRGLSQALSSCLTKLGVTVISQLPPYVTQHSDVLGRIVQLPSTDGILAALDRIAGNERARTEAVHTFNASASNEDREELVTVVENASIINDGTMHFLRQLKIFRQIGRDGFVSLQDVNCIGPDDFPPVLPRKPFLSCTPRSRQAAIRLGAQQSDLVSVVADMLDLMRRPSTLSYNAGDVSIFMKYFIHRRDLMDNQILLSYARQVKFVTTNFHQVRAADELYDPTSQILSDLLSSQGLLPVGDFTQSDILKKLRKLGLRTETNVQSEHLITAAEHIQRDFTHHNVSAALKASEALWKFLKNHGETFHSSTLARLSYITCMPCLQGKPEGYPASLPLRSAAAIGRPDELCSHKLIKIVGSSVHIMKPGMSEYVMSNLYINKALSQERVLQHLANVVKHYSQDEAAEYRFILIEIFKYLNQIKNTWLTQSLGKTKCVLVESGDRFVQPCSVWVQKGEDDLDLQPYRFQLASDLRIFKDLFLLCGSCPTQNEEMLREVIFTIQLEHEKTTETHPCYLRHLKLVQKILNRLTEADSTRDGSVPIPIIFAQPNVLRFKPARECTIFPDCGGTSSSSDADTLFFVHPTISRDTAIALGALEMRARSLTGLEAIDFDYGQREDLRDRLKDLLEHSYRDGLSVPKELIQNADDAGASKVCFLLDERENPHCRSNLFYPQMASQQGPAVWAYNDAKFSEEDVANITRLGARTKQEDASKVGKFGLGFNAVYNLTDTPCFLSGHVMGMFDPEEKYLSGKPGMKIDFRNPTNLALLSQWPKQFEPFQGVFDCSLVEDGNVVDYDGTLFRFPLRTPQQEEESKLNAKCYNKSKRRDFIKLILEAAGNLLLFTQNVQEIQVFHIPDDTADQSSPQSGAQRKKVKPHCLLTVRKTSRFKGGSDKRTVLNYCKNRWQYQMDTRILEELDVCVKLTDKAQALCGVAARNIMTHWRVVWATGTGESAEFAIRHQHEGLLPLAAVAVPLHEGRILRLTELPASFYKKGHLFCFLPLPEEMVREAFPVHVNSTFSLTSSRRSLQERTEDDTTSAKTEWNRALFRDPVCRAYILLLENLHKEATDQDGYGAYFELWPKARNSALKESFYEKLMSAGHKLFPVPQSGTWVSFEDARFLEPRFRDSDCGSIAWKVLKLFWNGGGSIVDVPTNICALLREADARRFNPRIVTKVSFYRDVFFPNINSEHISPEERDRLVFHALMDDDTQIQDLVRDHKCIPCEATSKLRRPKDLVHPGKEASKLFLSSEGLFPKGRGVRGNEHSGRVHFCSKKSLERLARLGMITDDLSPDRVLERTASIGNLLLENRQLALDRARHLIDYMSSYSSAYSSFRIDVLPAHIKSSMSKTKFLPVMKKPDEWPFAWNKNDSDTPELAPPCCLFFDSLKNLVACNAKLLDSNAMGYGGFRLQEKKKKDVLSALGMGVDEDHKSKEHLQLAISQLVTVTDHYQGGGHVNKQLMQTVTSTVYLFLEKCLRNCQTDDTAEIIREGLASRRCVWAGTDLVLPKQVAFRCDFECSPYLFKIESSLRQYRRLFEALGVKEEFGISDGIGALKQVLREWDGKPLPENILSIASRLAQLLAKAVQSSQQPVDSSQVFLPDRNGYMCCAGELCFDDDTNWLKSSNYMRFVSDKISAETAQLLGVKTKRRQDINNRGKAIPRGPKEELTTRIRGLLKGYIFDSSVLKELIQNADDAGATEIKFIKDFRQLSTEKVMLGWERLQGPALCVYNNAPFTDDDLEGIMKVGEGSKGTDPLKTGQYGVGFNAVYHLTDAPSFYTRTNDGKEVMVAFDPNYQFLPISPHEPPGLQFDDAADLKESYPDIFQGYFQNSLEMTKPGTIFRLPLRDEEMAKVSKIKQEAVCDTALTRLVDSFSEEMGKCLLFLTNLRHIAVYKVNADGALVLEHEVRKEMDDANTERMKTFQRSLQQATTQFTDGIHPTRIQESEAVLSVTLVYSKQQTEEWVIVNRIGFAGTAEAMQTEGRQDQFKLLPRGGVAAQMSCCSGSSQKTVPKTEECLAFCMLPLPVQTGLPVHVNGHFALDQEARRGLWDNEGDARTKWNKAIVLQVVVPAYITAIKHVKNVWFPANRPADIMALQRYHALFPDLQNAPSKRPWALLMKELYKQVAEMPLFPVVQDDKTIITWASVVKTDGFPGYFCNTTDFFKSILDVSRRGQNVVLSGGVQTASHQSGSEKVVKEMELRFIKLLKDLNMNVIHTPYSVMKNFLGSGVDKVQEVCPATLITFLKSASSPQEDGCRIGSLPTPVSETPFKDAPNIQLFLKFARLDKEFSDKLEGLPLCLRQSGQLTFFEKIEDTLKRPVASKFLHLLSGSPDMFLHERIYGYFLPVPEKIGEMVQEMNIDMLARMLPATVSVSVYRTGKPCPFLPDSLPCRGWLKNTWTFFEEQLREHKDKELVESRQIMDKLQSLAEWSLVPVKMKIGNAEALLLFPIKEIHNAVYLPPGRDVSHPDLWETLKSLCLPFLDTAYMPPLSIATKLVASISHPTALLQALTSCGTSLTRSREQAICVLSYFETSLPTLLESFDHESGLRQKLKSLPFFTDVDGNVGPIADDLPGICIAHDIPKEGLTVWSQNRLVLLRLRDIPHRLRDFFGFASPSSAEFYSVYLLLTFQALPRSAILVHMVFLREMFDCRYIQEAETDTLCKRLQETAFIEVNGRMYTANNFFSPFEPVFREMETCFPPEPYHSCEWSAFMRNAGIVWDVTDDMFIHYARTVEQESQNGLTESLAKKSHTLIRHLFQRKRLPESRLLERVQNIRFLPPSDWRSTPKGQRLALIAVPFMQDRLVSFAESCSERHLHVIWTSSCILHPGADPLELNLSPSERPEILRQLNWQEHAPEDKVMKHTENVCRALDVSEPQNSLAWKSENMSVVQQVMTDLYTYLYEHLRALDLSKLKQLPLICDTDNKQMLVAQNVIIHISDEDIITGYIHRFPTRVGQFVDLFKELGVRGGATADHYAKVLCQLKQQWGQKELHVEAMKIVSKTVQCLFKYLKSDKEEDSQLTVKHVYLPSELSHLLKSTKLVFKNNLELGERCKLLPNANFQFFLGFRRMKIHVSQPHEEIRLLPHKMTWLSDIVRETLPEEIKQRATDGEDSERIAEKLTQAEYVACVVRLAYHHHVHGGFLKTFNEDNERTIAEKMSSITVKEVTELNTVLKWEDEVVPDSVRRRDSFVDRNDAELYTVYFDLDIAKRSLRDVNWSLATAVQRTLKLPSMHVLLLQKVFENPKEASIAMDRSEIVQYSMRHREEGSIFQSPGEYVETRFHCYLVNRLDYVFSVGEHVGFALYDPQVSAVDTEENDPSYIYAVVRRRVDDGAGDKTLPCFRRYIVDVGPDQGGEVEVLATSLHLFSHPPRGEMTEALAAENTMLVTLNQGEGADTEETLPLDMETVLREIRQILSGAWLQPDASQRRRVVMRLYMQWHPDRNLGNEAFCTRVTQTIQRYVQLLEQGRSLDDEEADDEVDGSGFPSTFSRFFTRMDERSRAHRDDYEDNARDWGARHGGSSYSRGPSYGGGFWYSESRATANPQPGEARRWMRQAEADLATAQAASGTYDRGHSWICYQCHQAVEKALKAVILRKDANQKPQSHDLDLLASITRDPTLVSLASQLQSFLGSDMSMRYPDAYEGGRIPAEVYVNSHSWNACVLASQALQQARNLI